ncbi:Uncharacterized protein QTN25_008932 [Entamoeba marina]
MPRRNVSSPELTESEVKKKLTSVSSKHQFPLVIPSIIIIAITVALAIFALGLSLFTTTTKTNAKLEVVDKLVKSLQTFDLDDMNLEDVFFYNDLAESLNQTVTLPDLELQDLNIKEQPLNNLYFLTQLAEDYDLEIEDLEDEVFKFYRSYGFIDDLELLEQELEADETSEATVITVPKPQTIEACYYAIESMRKTGKLATFQETEQYKLMLQFIIKMQADSGLIYNSKNAETDLRITYFALQLLSDPKAISLFKNEINQIFYNVRTILEFTINLDGSYDFYFQDTPSCFGTAYGELCRKILGLPTRSTTAQYLQSCVTDKGPLVFRDDDETDPETGYVILSALTDVIIEKKSSSPVIQFIATLCMTAAVLLFVKSSISNRLFIEISVSVALFGICNIISYMWIESTPLLFILFPLCLSSIKIARRFKAARKNYLFWSLTLIPCFVGGLIFFIIDEYFPVFIADFSASYLLWGIIVVVMYFGQLGYVEIIKEKHDVQWFFDANQIAFAFSFITLFLMLAASENLDFIQTNLNLAGTTMTQFVSIPTVAYVLSITLSCFSIPAASKISLMKDK